ncbi:Patatin-like phospholipase [Roseimaritima multifibrata]|uniref:Patatin-like phospholipase n=1 Tax=Roseimaritima multifibrata TaxID=1930274 RepID=A0A517M941_9BACT|nr:patatin-like phospholipase family protein [Roseimaritima multifibrata]QDS91405.1 Patatin-like phospholipase [Roseimaritima multifibrata]
MNLNGQPEQQTTKPLRVLSLDGGGMRGIYSAAYLSRLNDRFAQVHKTSKLIDLGKRFDLIVGTSTGALIGCGLAKGVPLSEIVALYRNNGSNIFRRSIPKTMFGVPLDILKRGKALAVGEKSLREALQLCLGNTTLAEIYRDRNIAMAIPAVEMGRHGSWVFKTAHLNGSNHRDDDYSLVDVCMATSAAPLYRSLARIPVPDSGQTRAYNYFADGGLWANNPVLVGLIDSLGMASEGQEIQIYSLGTCSRPTGENLRPSDVNRGLVGWRFGADAAALSIDAQEMAYDYMARMLTKHVKNTCTIVRFPFDDVPAHMMDYLGLDDTREESMDELVRQAHSDADFTNSKCAKPEDTDGRLIASLFKPEE